MRLHRQSFTSKTPWLVLGASVCLSVFAALMTEQQSQLAREERFIREVDNLRFDLLKHMQTSINLLRSGAALFEASSEVSRNEWHSFFDAINLTNHHPEIQGVGYSPYVSDTEKQHLENITRQKNKNFFTIFPPGQRSHYTPILYLEPFDWRNQRAYGYDMYSEPTRRHAMDTARQTGLPSMTGPVKLVQETSEDIQVGTLIYFPLFSPTDAEDKSNNLQGFVYAAFRIKDLMQNVTSLHSRNINLTVRDLLTQKSLFADANHPAHSISMFSQHITTNIAGRQWVIVANSSPAFESETHNYDSLVIISIGLLDSLLLFFCALILVNNRITAQKAAAEHLKNLSLAQATQLMADSAPTALLAIDGHGKVQQFNHHALELFGYSAEQFQGLSVEKLIPKRFRQHHSKYRESFLTKPVKRPMGRGRDLYCLTALGKELPIEIGLTPTKNNETVICSINDISSRKTQENLLLKKTRELEEFVYVVSHDLKSPLVAINGLAGLLSKQLETDSEAHFLSERIMKNGQQMEALLQDLLDLSRISYSSHESLPINIKTLLKECVDDYVEHISAAEGTVDIDVPDAYIQGQKTTLHQLFNNLLDNAIKYRCPERPLLITIRGDIDSSKGRLYLRFGDNGRGVPNEWLAKIFDIFIRYDDKEDSGSGVGLSICKKVIERHDGQIWAAPHLPHGLEFCMDLPCLTSTPNNTN